jgi:hypothetical protein
MSTQRPLTSALSRQGVKSFRQFVQQVTFLRHDLLLEMPINAGKLNTVEGPRKASQKPGIFWGTFRRPRQYNQSIQLPSGLMQVTAPRQVTTIKPAPRREE